MRSVVLAAAWTLATFALVAACGAFGEGATEAPSPDAGDAGSPPDAGASASAEAGVDASVTCSDEQKTSAQHCGRCGRDCGGGQCIGGECRPYVLAPVVAAWYLAVDATHVYWGSRFDTGYATGTGDLWRIDKQGNGTALSLAVDTGIFDVAVLGGSVFYTVFGGTVDGVYRRPPTGLPTKVGPSALELVVQGTNLYAIKNDESVASLQVMTETGSSAAFVRAIGPRDDAPEGLATDDQYVYWTSHIVNGSIKRMKLTDKSISTVVSLTMQPRRMAVDDTFVYWTSDTELTIRRGAKQGGALEPALLTPVDVGYGRVLADETHLYATIDREGRVIRMDKDGKNLRELATGLDHPIGLAQDATAIYFAECSANGKLWRMVK